MIRLAVRVGREHADAVLAELIALVPAGFEEREVERRRRVRALRRAGRAARHRRGAGGGRRRARRRHDACCPTTGAEDWRSFHKPIRRRRRCRAAAVGAAADGTLDVVIEPGQAFGTGSHATTRLTLELLSDARARRRARRLGLRQRRARDRRGEARLGPGARLRHRARVGRGGPRGRARPTASRVEVSRCDVRHGGPPAPTVLANLVRPLLLEVAANLDGGPGPPDHLRRRGCTRPTRSSPRSAACARSRAAMTAQWAAVELVRTMITLDDVQAAARRIDGRRAPHAGHHRPPARRGHRRRPRAAQGREPPARRRVQVPRRLQRRRVAERERARARRRDRLLRQPRAGAWRSPRGCTRRRP